MVVGRRRTEQWKEREATEGIDGLQYNRWDIQLDRANQFALPQQHLE